MVKKISELDNLNFKEWAKIAQAKNDNGKPTIYFLGDNDHYNPLIMQVAYNAEMLKSLNIGKYYFEAGVYDNIVGSSGAELAARNFAKGKITPGDGRLNNFVFNIGDKFTGPVQIVSDLMETMGLGTMGKLNPTFEEFQKYMVKNKIEFTAIPKKIKNFYSFPESKRLDEVLDRDPETCEKIKKDFVDKNTDDGKNAISFLGMLHIAGNNLQKVDADDCLVEDASVNVVNVPIIELDNLRELYGHTFEWNIDSSPHAIVIEGSKPVRDPKEVINSVKVYKIADLIKSQEMLRSAALRNHGPKRSTDDLVQYVTTRINSTLETADGNETLNPKEILYLRNAIEMRRNEKITEPTPNPKTQKVDPEITAPNTPAQPTAEREK